MNRKWMKRVSIRFRLYLVSLIPITLMFLCLGGIAIGVLMWNGEKEVQRSGAKLAQAVSALVQPGLISGDSSSNLVGLRALIKTGDVVAITVYEGTTGEEFIRLEGDVSARRGDLQIKSDVIRDALEAEIWLSEESPAFPLKIGS